MVEFYEKLYSESEDWSPTFEYNDSPKMSQEEQDYIQRPFAETEVL